MGRETRIYSDQVHASSDPALHKALTSSAPVFLLKSGSIEDAKTKETAYQITQSTASGSLTHRPLLTITREGADVGSVKFKTLHSGIDLNVHNKHTELHSNSLGAFKYYFAPTCDDKLRWCWAEGNFGELVLIHEQLDERKIALVHKTGVLEFEDEYDASWVEDVIVSAVAVWYKNLGLDVGDSKIGEMVEGWKATLTG